MWGKLKREVGNLVVLSSCFCPVWYETAIFSSHQKTMKGFYLQHFSKIISLLNKKGKTHLRYYCSIGPQYIRSLGLEASPVAEYTFWLAVKEFSLDRKRFLRLAIITKRITPCEGGMEYCPKNRVKNCVLFCHTSEFIFYNLLCILW